MSRAGKSSVRDLTPSDTQSLRSMRSMASSITDVEEDSEQKYKKLSKKLLKQRDELKSEMKKLVDQFEERIRDIRTTESEHQKTIIDLQQENRHLREEKNASTKPNIKRLESTITALQERLNNMADEKQELLKVIEEYKKENVTASNAREKENKQTISQLEEQNTNLKLHIENLKKELKNVVTTMEVEKQNIQRQFQLERENDIRTLQSKTTDNNIVLNSYKDQAEKRINLLERQKEQSLLEAKKEIELVKQECDKRMNEMVISTKKQIEQCKEAFDSQMDEYKRQKQKEYDTMCKDFQARIDVLEHDSKIRHELQTNTLTMELRKEKSANEQLQGMLDQTRKQYMEESERKENELKQHYKSAFDKSVSDLKSVYDNKIKELNDLCLNEQKKAGEAQDDLIQLKEQYNQLKDINRKLQENLNSMNVQYFSTMTKEKEAYDNNLRNKEILIENLNNQLKKVKDEVVERFNAMERKSKSMQEDLKEMTDKYTNTKATLTEAERVINGYKTDTFRQKEITDRFTKKLEALQADREESDKRFRAILSDKDKDLAVFRQQLKDTEAKDVQIAELTNQVNNMQANFVSTIDKLTQEHRKERDELVELRSRSMRFTDQINEIEKMRAVIQSMKDSFYKENHKNEETHKNEMKKLQSRLNQAEMEILQNDQRIEKMKLDFLKQLNEQRKLPYTDQEKLVKLEKENNDLKVVLERTENKLQDINAEYASAVATFKMKMNLIAEKENALRRKEEEIQNTPPKLLDPEIKKQRDTALAQLRQKGLEVGKIKEEAIQMTQKLQIAENLIKESEKEKTQLLNAQNDMKQTFVDQLNQQQAKFEKDLVEKNERIQKLEHILMTKLGEKA